MASVNKVIILGFLGQDPQTRYTTGGEAVASLSVATSDQWRDKAGERQEKTEWHRVIFFGKLAEVVGEHFKKGSRIYVEGKLTTRKWSDKDGTDRYTTEIVGDRFQFIDKKDDGPVDSRPAKTEPAKAAATTEKKRVDDIDDHIPFVSGDPSFDIIPQLDRRLGRARKDVF